MCVELLPATAYKAPEPKCLALTASPPLLFARSLPTTQVRRHLHSPHAFRFESLYSIADVDESKMMSQQPSSAGNTLSANPNQLGVRGLSGDPTEFRKSHAFDYRHGAPIERDSTRSPSLNERSNSSLKFLPPKYVRRSPAVPSDYVSSSTGCLDFDRIDLTMCWIAGCLPWCVESVLMETFLPPKKLERLATLALKMNNHTCVQEVNLNFLWSPTTPSAMAWKHLSLSNSSATLMAGNLPSKVSTLIP